MTEPQRINPSSAFARDQVAPLLPATAPEPEPARRISFWIALLAYWIVPKRIGPHLAVGTWKRALAAHALALLVTPLVIAAIGIAFAVVHDPNLHELRNAIAEGVLIAASASTLTPWLGVPWWGIAVTAIGLELLPVILAVLFMPWCAGGDSAGSVVKRSLKNVYWSTTCLPVAAAAFALLGFASNENQLYTARLSDLFVVGVLIFTAGTPVFLWLRALLVGASRYAGPPSGPAFRPREPLCDRCGYCITGLALAAHCPECDWPVRESLPGGRRQPTTWQQHSFRPRGILDAARLQWTIFRNSSFFERLVVHEGHLAARHFWWATFFFVLLAVILFCWLIMPLAFLAAGLNEDDLLGAKILTAIIGLLAPFCLQTFLSFAACLWAQLKLGIRDYRVSASVCYYASPLMWPVVLTLLSFGVLPILPYTLMRMHLFEVLGLDIRVRDAIGLGAIVLLVVTILFWWLRLLDALRKVRHANV